MSDLSLRPQVKVKEIVASAESALPETLKAFSFLDKYLPELVPNLQEWAKGDVLRALVEWIMETHGADDPADVLDQVRAAMAEIAAIRSTDFITAQIERIREALKMGGTVDGKQAFVINAVLSGLHKSHKTVNEIKELAALSRKPRSETPNGNPNDLNRILENAARGEVVADGEDMTTFHGPAGVRLKPVEEGVFDLIDGDANRELSPDEQKELFGGNANA
jgi:hypothetical protein